VKDFNGSSPELGTYVKMEKPLLGTFGTDGISKVN
jgi:hypothetical protein